MVSSTDTNKAARVVSIKALDYELVSNACFHPSLYTAACARISEQFAKTHAAHPSVKKLTKILEHTLANPACKKVWAIVIEEEGNPLYVIRNLKYTGTTLAFRRVFRVKVDMLLALPADRQEPIVVQPIIVYKPEPLSGMSHACAVGSAFFHLFLIIYSLYIIAWYH